MKVLKIISKFLLAFILLTLIFWTILFGTLQTERGKNWALNQLITYLENQTQTHIDLEDVQFTFPLNIRLKNLVISRKEHPLLTLENAELSCAYLPLFQGRLVFSTLQASEINLLYVPEIETSSIKIDDQPWDAIRLPFYVKVEKINIQNIHLAPEVIDHLSLPSDIRHILQHSSLNLQGIISNNPFKSAMTAHLLITAKDIHSDTIPLSLGIDAQNHSLSLSFHVNHLTQYLPQATLPSALKAHLAFYASAPTQTWQHILHSPLTEENPLEGHFRLFLQSPEDNSLLSTLIGQKTIVRSKYILKSLKEIELFDLKVESPSLSLEGEAILTANHEIHHGNFKGQVNHLERFRLWLGQEVQGNFLFEGHATGPLQAPSLTFNLKSQALQYSQHQVQNIRSTLQATPRNKGFEGFVTLALDYQQIPLQFASSFDWDLQRLAFSNIRLDAMQSRLEGEVSCLTEDFIWEGTLYTHSGNLKNISHFWDLSLSGETEIKVDLKAFWNPKEQKTRQGFQMELTGQALQWREWQAKQLSIHLHADPLLEGEEFFQIYSRLEGEGIRGKNYGVGHCLATTTTTHQADLLHLAIAHLSTDWTAEDIWWDQGRAAQARGQMNIKNPSHPLEGTIQLAIQRLQTSSLQLEEVSGSSRFDSLHSQWPFYIEGRGEWKEKLIFAANGIWHYDQQDFDLQLDRLEGRFGPYPFQLLQPTYFSHHSEKYQLAGLYFKWGEAELRGDFSQEGQTFSSQFQTNAIPSELFHFIHAEFPLVGRATFSGYLQGSIQQPSGQLKIALHRMQITENIFTQKPFIGGEIQLDLDSGGTQISSQLHGIGQTPVSIRGHLPLFLTADAPYIKLNQQLPLEVALNAEGELDPYLHLFYNDTTNLSGQAKIALQFSGQINAPQIRGYIDLSHGAYESLSTGALFHNIHAHLEGNGSKIILTQFSAQDNKQGSIAATGAVTLNASENFPFEFHIQPKLISIIDSDYATLSSSGNLTLLGNTKKSKLQGQLTVDQAVIRLKDTLPRQIKTVDVRYINLTHGESLPAYLETKESTSSMELDIRVNLPGKVNIQGNRFSSEWKGDLTVTGTPETPYLNGDLRSVQGEYNLNGKVFQLSQGNIHFGGPLSKKTTLYIVASKDIDRIRAEIIVKGPIDKPAISFRSNPPLSQREVLSYILFNRGIADITPNQGDQLSQSFISLNTSEQTSSSEDFLSRVRNNIGIDRLDFAVADNENKDLSLQAGKYITENIFVSINRSITNATSIAVEANLRKNLKIQADKSFLGDDSSQFRMSLKWKKDY